MEPAPEASVKAEEKEEEDRAGGIKEDGAEGNLLRRCVRLAREFKDNHVPEWPWHPGCGEVGPQNPEDRARRGSRSATLFTSWMQRVADKEENEAAAAGPEEN